MLSAARPIMPRANHQTATLRRFRNTAATARAALNAAAIKANVDSDVTADGLPDRAMKSFPTYPTKVWVGGNFSPKCAGGRGHACLWSKRASQNAARHSRTALAR